LTNEAFARIKIDQLLKDTGWRLTDGISVRYEYPLDDGGRADYVLFDRQGRALACRRELRHGSVEHRRGAAEGDAKHRQKDEHRAERQFDGSSDYTITPRRAK
jgi:hypothetical protein